MSPKSDKRTQIILSLALTIASTAPQAFALIRYFVQGPDGAVSLSVAILDLAVSALSYGLWKTENDTSLSPMRAKVGVAKSTLQWHFGVSSRLSLAFAILGLFMGFLDGTDDRFLQATSFSVLFVVYVVLAINYAIEYTQGRR